MRFTYLPRFLCKTHLHSSLLLLNHLTNRTAGMYMQEVLETVCRKRKLNPNEYALLVRDMSILIPLDRTVASLEGKSDLVLVKRSMLPRYGIDAGKSLGRTTDPNGERYDVVLGLSPAQATGF